jgi:multidrug efflux pump subunit AcrB
MPTSIYYLDQRVGVGGKAFFGPKDYSMRIWLKPDVMGAYGLIPSEYHHIIAEQNIEAAQDNWVIAINLFNTL